MMGFYALTAAWLFALIVPLVVLYFLKLKRPRQVIPSLVLWQQVLADQRVNSPFQRFKRNLLLLVQLLILCLLALAAMQPYLRGGADAADRLLVLIDHSASMAALDKPGGQSRLDEAKQRVRSIIDDLAPDQELAIIGFAGGATQAADFTSNKRLLHEALEKTDIEDVPSRPLDALSMAEAMARSGSGGFDRVLMLSDGVIGEGLAQGDARVIQLNYNLPFELDYQLLEKPGPNIGITAVSARQGVSGGWNVFARVQGAAMPATLELVQNGQVLGSEHVVINSEEGQRFVFPLPGEQAASIELRLRPDDFDSLAADNAAYLELKPARPLRVYVSPSLEAFGHAVAAHERVQIAADGPFDLVISDAPQTAGAELPGAGAGAAVALHVGVIPEDLKPILESASEHAPVVDWNRASLLLEHVELSEVVILDDIRWSSAAREQELENRGYEVVVHGQRGPLLLQKREGERIAYYMLFHTDRSTLPFRVGFPIFVANLMRAAMQQAGLLETPAPQTGVLPPLQLVTGTEYQVRGPGGYARRETTDAQGVMRGVPAPRVGQYSVMRGGDTTAAVGVSLLSPTESMLKPVDRIEFPEQAVQASATASAPVNRSIWWTIAAIALALLVIEWWMYQRPPGIPAPAPGRGVRV